MTMSALQQILAGKKPQPASPPSSLAAATPAAQPAASAPPPATTAHAAAGAPSAPSPSPVAAPTRAASIAAAAPAVPTVVVPGPNAAAVATPQGGPPDTLAAVLGAFVANAGKMPQVNPPEAAKVLAGPTALEVAGHPESEAPKEAAPAPVEKPADVLAAEQAKKARRTAAVVQAELDIALQKIATLEAALAAKPGEEPTVHLDATQADDQVQAALAEAVELIQQLQAEAKVQTEDNAKAWARVAEVEAERDHYQRVAQDAADAGKRVLPEVTEILSFDSLSRDEIEGALLARLPVGVSITLTGQR